MESNGINLEQYFSTAQEVKGCFAPKQATEFLLVCCSDRNFRKAFSGFEDPLEPFGVDRVVDAGGPLVLLEELSAGEGGSSIERVKFLASHHKVKQIVLIGHSACGAYGAKYQGQGLSQEQLDERVKADLLELKAKMETLFPGLAISAMFAKPFGQDVSFMPV